MPEINALTPELKAVIDSMSLESMLRRNRFAQTGDVFFQGEIGKYFLERMGKLRDENPEEWTAASKKIGWQ